jgi:hypothetical protein
MSSFYPIRNLDDILAKFRAELNEALAPIYERLDRLEGVVLREGVTPATVTPAEGEETVISEETLDAGTLRDYIIQVRYLNMALRGYGMLLTELGLPKDMRMAIRRIEDMVMMMLRLMQLIRMLDWMLAGTYAMGPFGWLVAGGFFAGMIAYGGKTLGGF